MTSTTTLELENYSYTRNSQTDSIGRQAEENVERHGPVNEQTLERADGGPSAWKLLIAAFVFEAVLWGFPLSFGVFQNYYSQLPEFSNNPFLPVVGSMATGIAFLGGPFMTPLVKRFPKHRVHMIMVGWPLCIAGLVAGSFANTLPTLIVTQGIMYGTGFVTFYYPIIEMVNEWWVTRRGLAWGIIASASGASGVVMPFIVEALLNKYGYKTTLRAIAVALVILTGPLIPLFRGRLPPAERSVVAKTDWSFFKKPVFWIYSSSNLAQGLGFFFPSLYLPSYAASIGLSATQGALLLALMNVSQMLGQFTFGILSDGRVPVNVLILVSTVVTALASLTLWGLAHSLGPLIAFALIYGFFGYGYVSLRVKMGAAISSDPTAALATFSIFCFGQGVGNVLAGPISASLITRVAKPGDYGALKYKSVVIFTGCAMVLSAVSIGSFYVRPKRMRV